MGENKHIKELDDFAKKYVKEIEQETPSLDFTASIMKTVLAKKPLKVIKFEPLISKKIWFVVAGLFAALLFIPFKESEKTLLKDVPELDFSFLEKIQVPSFLEHFSVSNTVLYAVFFFGFMIIAQVIFLKNHFNKRFE